MSKQACPLWQVHDGIHSPRDVRTRASRGCGALWLALFLTACGGGGGSEPPPGPPPLPPADFYLSVEDAAVTVSRGSSVFTWVDAPIWGEGATNYQLQLSVSGLPAGVTATFGSSTIPVGSTTTLTLAAASDAPTCSNRQITVVATRSADGVAQSAQFRLSVAPPPGTLPGNRTDFVRLDGQPASAVYDPVHRRVFASNPDFNRVDVIDVATARILTSIPAPKPQGLDLTLDGERVIVGTSTQQLLAIDAAKLEVVERTTLPKVFFSGSGEYVYVAPERPLVTANGTMLMTGPMGLVQWKPATRAVVSRNAPGGYMARSADGSKVILASTGSNGQVALYDAATDSFPYSTSFGCFLYGVAANPDGSQFAVASYNGFFILDSGLNVIGSIPVGGYFAGARYSPDGQWLYIVIDAWGLPLIVTVESKTLAVVGLAPAYATTIAFFTRVPPLFIEKPLAVDETGLIFGAADHGLAFDDATNYQNLTSDLSAIYASLVTPAQGPLNTPTPVTIPGQAFDIAPDIWFGSQRGTDPHLDGPFAQATAPPSSVPGPVNVKIVQSTGVVSVIPQGFTYGTEALYLGGSAGSPAGGYTIDIFGYGFLANLSAISVTVGGGNAPVTSVQTFPGEEPYPFPLHHLKVTVPSGSPGPADVTVSTPAGSSTLTKAIHYAKSVRDYAAPETFTHVLYDRFRRRVYLSAGSQVDVFSLDSEAFLAPIVPPSLNGSRQMAGLALTPDGSRLLVANFSDQSVAAIDPDNPAAAVAVLVVPPGTEYNPGPDRIATTSTGKAFITTAESAVSGCGGQLRELDLTTLAVTIRADPALDCLEVCTLRIAASTSGERVFIGSPNNDGGPIYIWGAATDTWLHRGLGGLIYDAAASGDGNVFAANVQTSIAPNFRIVDPQANLVTTLALPETLQYVGERVISQKLNESGSLLYSPFRYGKGIDILDVQQGNLRQRIALTQTFPYAHDALALDETGEHIFLITDAGLTVIEVDAVPLSIASVTPGSGAAAGGTQVTIRGSGFRPGASVTFSDSPASTSFIDANTLQVLTPALPAGLARITVTNPGGDSYSLDAAYTAN